MNQKRYALLSTWNKEGLVPFARGLLGAGFSLLSTGGTANVLREAGIAVTDLEAYTGAPEILRGRVKSLHPKIFAGILGIPEFEDHAAQLSAQGIEMIDLVGVNFYPFEEVVSRGNPSFGDAIEHIDIGGPSLVRAAAKNCRRTTVVIDPADYEIILAELREFKEVRWQTRLALAHKAFRLTAHYDAIIVQYLASQGDDADSFMAETFTLTGRLWRALRYGENPHQRGWAYQALDDCAEVSVIGSEQLNGEPLSYTNILDADAAVALVKKCLPPACVIVKHANPCGVAEGTATLTDSYLRALRCDERSAFGGIVALNECVDGELAKHLVERFFEVVIAPEISSEAQEVFKRKSRLKVIRWRPVRSSLPKSAPLIVRSVSGGFLIQERDLLEKEQQWKVVTKRAPTASQREDLEFAMKVAAHVSSNAIVLAKEREAIGIGAGQMSRIDSIEIAISKAQQPLAGAVLASDAFFPFRDSIDRAAAAGITAVIQPGGSKRDSEVIEAAEEHGLAMIFTGRRHFRH